MTDSSLDMSLWLFALGAAFAIIGFVTNLLVVVVAWSLKREVSSLKDSITTLSNADSDLAQKIENTGSEITRLERSLSDHRLHVAEHYARKEAIDTLFEKLEEIRGSMLSAIREYITDVNRRVDSALKTSGN